MSVVNGPSQDSKTSYLADPRLALNRLQVACGLDLLDPSGICLKRADTMVLPSVVSMAYSVEIVFTE